MFKKVLTELKENKKSFFWLIIFVLLFALLLPDKQTIESTLEEIKGASIEWILLGSVIYYLTIPIYAAQILVLSKIKLRLWITYKVQMSVLFINKFLPSAISSFAMNSFYLNRVGHKASEVGSIIAMQGITSSIPFTILFITAIIVGIAQYNLNDMLNLNEINWIKIIAIVLIIIAAVIFVIRSSSKLTNFIDKTFGSLWVQIKQFRKRPMSLFWALSTGFIAPLFGVAVLYTSGHSVDLSVSFVQSFLIYSLATTMANLIPVPGGIGAAEAGLVAGFTFFGYPSAESLAAALIYRIITFWIPTIPGVIFFVDLRKDVLKGFSISGEFAKIKKSRKA